MVRLQTFWYLVLCLIAISGPRSNSVLADEPTHKLQYKFQKGDVLRYRVEHLAKTNVRVNGDEELSQVRSVSLRVWQVTDVNEKGEMIFENGIESVEMTQQNGDQDEIRWNSGSEEIPPVQFNGVAKRIGKVISTLRINPQGQVTDRQGEANGSSSLGMGDVTMPLPADPIKIGGRWSVPREAKVTDEEGRLKVIKIRELYTLEKVQTGVATITIRSEPLTPIEDQNMRGQLVQQLSNGTIRFDVDAGRIISRQLDWDENVVGFQGPTSNLEYQARLSETLEKTDPAVARGNGPLTR